MCTDVPSVLVELSELISLFTSLLLPIKFNEHMIVLSGFSQKDASSNDS